MQGLLMVTEGKDLPQPVLKDFHESPFGKFIGEE